MVVCLLVVPASAPVYDGAARDLVRQGNRLYAEGEFSRAIGKYDGALVEQPAAAQPEFNKANAYYRLDDLAAAMELYRNVAATSRDMELVSKARYNLGNCCFQQGMKQRDSNLQKAIDDLKTSIAHWRQVLDIEPNNEKAARNIEVARLIIKDILDQLNKQRDPNQPQDPNQSQQQGQRQQQQQSPPRDANESGEQQQQQAGARHDANEPEDANQPRQQQQAVAPDTTADEMLDQERKQREERQILQRARYQEVEKDW